MTTTDEAVGNIVMLGAGLYVMNELANPRRRRSLPRHRHTSMTRNFRRL